MGRITPWKEASGGARESSVSVSPGTANGWSETHRAENSSKVSSWCSERRRVDVLKVLLSLGAARAARAAIGCGRAATMLARKTALEGPRAATRSREADIFDYGRKSESPEPGGVARLAIGGGAGSSTKMGWPGKELGRQLIWAVQVRVRAGVRWC